MNTLDEINKAYWDLVSPVHRDSTYYELERFRSGESTLKWIEERELGNLTGKTVLHLQCHIGLHTLSLERNGASVIGVDYSSRAIEIARELKHEQGMEAEFVCCNVYDLPQFVQDRFDIVFTSYGVLYCLQDLVAWGRIVARFLKPDGFFYIVDLHPLFYTLDDNGKTLVNPYFHAPEGELVGEKGVLVVPSSGVKAPFCGWTHSLGDVVTALASAGLVIEFLHEHPFISYNARSFLISDDNNNFRIKDRAQEMPMMFSIRARLPHQPD